MCAVGDPGRKRAAANLYEAALELFAAQCAIRFTLSALDQNCVQFL